MDIAVLLSVNCLISKSHVYIAPYNDTLYAVYFKEPYLNILQEQVSIESLKEKYANIKSFDKEANCLVLCDLTSLLAILIDIVQFIYSNKKMLDNFPTL